MKKKLITAVMLSTTVLTTAAPLMSVGADTFDAKISNQDAKIASTTSSAKTAKSEADDASRAVTALTAQRAATQSKLNQLLSEQKQQSKKIASLNTNIQDRNEALKSQARNAQVNSSKMNYLSAIVDSKSITEAIQNVTGVMTVTNANRRVLKAQQADQKALQSKLEDNQAKVAQAAKLQTQLDNQTATLKAKQASAEAAQLSYQAEIATAQADKQALLDQKAQAEQAAAEAEAMAKTQAAPVAKVTPITPVATQRQSSEKSVSQPKATTPTVTPDASNTPAVTPDTTPVTPSVTPDTTPVTPSVTPDTSDTTPTPVTPNIPDVTPQPEPSHKTNPYPAGQCTAYVWERLGGNMPTYLGNAGDWAVYANSGAAVGTIAVFPPGNQGAGSVGHVAVVEAILGNGQIRISEGNFNGGWATSRVVSTSGLSFINPN